jgi:hypothetical protein
MRNSSARTGTKFDDSRAAELKERLADGIDRLVSGEDWQDYLKFQAAFPRYSFTNMMLVYLQRPDATMVMGAGKRKDGKQAGWAALGRTVTEGREEAGKIFIWKPWTKTVEAENPGEKNRTYLNFYPVPVYDVSDTEGDPVPEGATVRLLEGDGAKGLLKLTLEFITASGFTYELLPGIPGSQANGDMNPVSKHVRVCTEGRSEKQQAKTAIHEAAHMILHSGGKGISVPREQKEVEAESAAYVVSAHLGVDTGDYSFGYVARWAAATGFTPRTAIKHSGKRIQEVAAKIIRAVALADTEEDAA